MAKNGETDVVAKSLEYIRKAQEGLKKPIFTEQNKAWNFTVIAQAEVEKESPTGEIEIAQYEGAKVVNNLGDERVRILFDERPSAETILILKKSGWRWSPSNSAWQRKNTANGIYNSSYALKQAGFTPQVAAPKPGLADYHDVAKSNTKPETAEKSQPISPETKISDSAKFAPKFTLDFVENDAPRLVKDRLKNTIYLDSNKKPENIKSMKAPGKPLIIDGKPVTRHATLQDKQNQISRRLEVLETLRNCVNS
jgi:hypothetical protein